VDFDDILQKFLVVFGFLLIIGIIFLPLETTQMNESANSLCSENGFEAKKISGDKYFCYKIENSVMVKREYDCISEYPNSKCYFVEEAKT
jgi:hypothetical protein